jgi:hypothetical protein
MKCYFLFMFVVFFGGVAGATHTEDIIAKVEIGEIRRAINAQDLAKIKAYFQELRIAQGACERQLHKQMVPFACYHIKDLVPAGSELKNILIPEARLRKACAEGVANYKGLGMDTESLPDGDCRSAVVQKLELNRYKYGL